MYFDCHADILYNIVTKRLAGQRHIIKDHHLTYLQNGHFKGGIWCYYTDIHNPLCEFDRAINFILEEIESAEDVIQVVRRKDDFSDDKLNVILGFESLVDIKNIDHLDTMHDYGFRHAMLTWNEANHYATGVEGDSNRGLTEEGEAILHYMEQHHMIVDVSHANEKTFNDILRLSTKPILASHSNVYPLFPHDRNLEERQINKIVQTGGLIGLTPVWKFLAEQRVSINSLMKHIEYYRDHDLLDHVSFGYDFMYYMDNVEGNLTDLCYPIDTCNLRLALFDAGYDAKEVKKITHQNALNFLKSIL